MLFANRVLVETVLAKEVIEKICEGERERGVGVILEDHVNSVVGVKR